MEFTEKEASGAGREIPNDIDIINATLSNSRKQTIQDKF